MNTKPEIKGADEGSSLEFLRRPYGLAEYQFYRLQFIFSHLLGLYFFLYLIPFGYVPLSSLIAVSVIARLCGFGTTIGSHRYWTHRAFKANKALQVLLMILQTAMYQGPIYYWCRNHRVHHKYTDTDADPHNSKRGFWFSHMLWHIFPYHQKMLNASNIVYIKDLETDPVVRFQCFHYQKLILVFFYAIPMIAFKLIYPEWSFLTILSANFARYLVNAHGSFMVNSVAHKWGSKPYDKYISSVDNSIVSYIAMGEGYHNYHHTFPWDYRTSESGLSLNLSSVVINAFAYIGWAYDLKTVNQEMLFERIHRTGDGTHLIANGELKNKIGKTEKDFVQSLAWGWGDSDIANDALEITDTLFVKGGR